MGLDMYLHRKTYVKNWDHMELSELHEVTVKKGGKPRKDINPKKVSEITEEVGYWRKANHIHAWFVENTQDGEDRNGQESYVSKGQLMELYNICVKIRDNCRLVPGKVHNGTSYSGGKTVEIWEDGEVMENTELAKELLPTKSGFFFGGTNYDEYYMQDIINTIEILKPLIEEEYEGSIYYQSSW